jgi:hypothetical protein
MTTSCNSTPSLSASPPPCPPWCTLPPDHDVAGAVGSDRPVTREHYRPVLAAEALNSAYVGVASVDNSVTAAGPTLAGTPHVEASVYDGEQMTAARARQVAQALEMAARVVEDATGGAER